LLPLTTLLTDFNTWTEIEDPAHDNFNSSVDSPSQVTLSADGAVPLATDIGYKSINGLTAALSTSGNAFDPAFDFSLAIDYDISTGLFAAGGLTLGFGIGEDDDGTNSAGAVLSSRTIGILTRSSSAGAARIDDLTQTPLALAFLAPNTGSFFVSYEASSGNVTVGVGTAGAATPNDSDTFNNIQQSWNGSKLFPSFFLRSDSASSEPWALGTADAVFSNLRVLEGTPVGLLIPEPSSLALTAIGCLGLLLRSCRQS
jgi:hypothetical protein